MDAQADPKVVGARGLAILGIREEIKLPGKRKRIRLPNYDYSSPGAYFITICVKNKVKRLGVIKYDQVRASALGLIVIDTWENLHRSYEHIRLDDFVVMPNHFHDILWLNKEPKHVDGVGAGFKPAPTLHGLSEVVRGFKSLSARRINESFEGGEPFRWQRSFYDHVIRDDVDLYQHRKYIQENPLKWTLDQYYS